MKNLRTLIFALLLIQSLFIFIHFGLDIHPENFPSTFSIAFNAILLFVSFFIYSRRFQSFIIEGITISILYLLIFIIILPIGVALRSEYLFFALVDILFFVAFGISSGLIRNTITSFELTFASFGTNVFHDLDDPQVKQMVHSEIMRSRYSKSPLSIIKIKPRGGVDNPVTKELIEELFTQNQGRFLVGYVARLLNKEVRLIDHILFDSRNDELIIFCPDLNKKEAQNLAHYFEDKLENSSHIKIESSQASFPEDGVTFDSLLRQSRTNRLPESDQHRIVPKPDDYDFITQST